MQNGVILQITRRGVSAARYSSRHNSQTRSIIPRIRYSSSSSPSLSEEDPPAVPPRQWSTPLAKTIAAAIEATGPISIASYMRQCLTNPEGGYYTATRRPSTDSDPFGAKGDFVTSPEISQIFGELMGIWFMTEWMGQGRPSSGVQFIEMGPGRGTLMSDILRTIGQFKSFAGAVEAVWLVEAGEGLRKKQRDILCGDSAELVEKKDETGKNVWWEAESKYAGIPVRWVEDIVLLPQSDLGSQKTPFVIAHEFFDALPIHAFQSVPPKAEEDNKPQLLDKDGNPMVRPSTASKLPQWRELLVSPTKRKFALPPIEGGQKPSSTTKDPDPDFQLTLAKASTPTSLVLPERSRYRQLKSQVDSRVEISPESSRYVQEIARRIGGGSPSSPQKPTSTQHKPAGAALIIDYGPAETIPINSLRGIRKHKVISPFVFPGDADISADVDFGALADSALEASPGVEVHGPVEQGLWLSQLGIQERAERLMKNMPEDWAGETSVKKKEFENGWKRLVEAGPKGMGKAYKVMAIVPENGGKRRPVGFGGGVVA